MERKKIISILFVCLLLPCLFLFSGCGDNNTNNNSSNNSIIATAFNCNETQATAMDSIFTQCKIKVAKENYVTRDSSRDWGTSMAYVVKWDVTLDGRYSQERFYVYLDANKKIVDVRIWSDYLYKNYSFVQTAQTLYTKQTSSYTVTFNPVVDYDYLNGRLTQSIKYGNYATAPNVQKIFYEFLGWSIDGTNIVNVGTYMIKQNTTFIALWNNNDFYEVNFMIPAGSDYSGDTQQFIDNNCYAVAPIIYNNDFLGWSIDGENIVDVASYKITAETLFIPVMRNN